MQQAIDRRGLSFFYCGWATGAPGRYVRGSLAVRLCFGKSSIAAQAELSIGSKGSEEQANNSKPGRALPYRRDAARLDDVEAQCSGPLNDLLLVGSGIQPDL